MIALMTIGLLLGCAQNENDDAPDVKDELQEDMNDIEEETDNMFEEDIPEDGGNQEGTDNGGDTNAPEEDEE